LEGWTNVLYNNMDAVGSLGPILFFLTLVFFGGMFAMNLVLAVVWDAFVDSEAEIETDRINREARAWFDACLNPTETNGEETIMLEQLLKLDKFTFCNQVLCQSVSQSYTLTLTRASDPS
jgi:hypothetical protein